MLHGLRAQHRRNPEPAHEPPQALTVSRMSVGAPCITVIRREPSNSQAVIVIGINRTAIVDNRRSSARARNTYVPFAQIIRRPAILIRLLS